MNFYQNFSLKRLWQVPLGPSYSGPLVVGPRVFVTETLDRQFEIVRCLDRSTGKQLWEHRWEGALSVPFFAKSNGDWIRATPAYEDGKLYVAGIRDVLVCLDAERGTELWRVDFVKQLGSALPTFGFVSSPLVIGDSLYVQAGGAFLKLEKKTGKIVWQALADGGGMSGSAFSSPYRATLLGQDQILVQTRDKLAGVKQEDGSVLWAQEIPAFRGMNILTPTVHEGLIFTSSYGGKSLGLRPSNEGGWKLTEAWQNKTQGYMSSPIVVNGHAYLHLRNQRFTCIDLATGTEKWTTTPFGKYWSMAAHGDRLLALDERGELLLIRANPEKFELIDRLQLELAETWAHLAVSGNQLFVRALDSINAYQFP